MANDLTWGTWLRVRSTCAHPDHEPTSKMPEVAKEREPCY